jgi:hypothetical protein
MFRKLLVVVAVLVVFVQAGFAQTTSCNCSGSGSVRIVPGKYLALLFDDVIWIDTMATPQRHVRNGTCDVGLKLADTNPTFFALVYNTLRDYMRNGNGNIYIVSECYVSGTSKYAKIKYVQVH